jgi:hypothetical protein
MAGFILLSRLSAYLKVPPILRQFYHLIFTFMLPTVSSEKRFVDDLAMTLSIRIEPEHEWRFYISKLVDRNG